MEDHQDEYLLDSSFPMYFIFRLKFFIVRIEHSVH